MKLSKQTTDAVEILVYCVNPETDLVKVGDIAEELGLSRQMALKLSYVLGQAGFVETVRGPKGGIRLTKASREARLGEIVRALELAPLGRSAESSLFEGYIDDAFEAFLSVLDQHTLADLARRPSQHSKKKTRKKRARRAKQGIASRSEDRIDCK